MDTDAVLVSPENPVVIAKEREDHEKRMPRSELPEHTPKLFFLFPPGADSLRPDLQKQANLRTLQLISEEQLNNDELEQLWSLLEQHVSETTIKNQRLISHSDFCRLQMVLSEKCRKFLTASAFAQLLSTSPYLHRVEIDAIQEFTVRQMREMQWRIELTLYDEVGQGYLREYDLENYLMDLLPKLSQLQEQMSPSFQKFYICSVAKRIFFFLDPLRRGRVSICDLLASEMFAELVQQRGESDSMEESMQQSPFSLPAIHAIYENYLSLDIDRNGLLSKEELAGYGSGTLTSAFLDRVFEESHTYYGEMDYKSFLDFVFALENRQTPAALHYLFRMLDMDHVGYLTTQTVQHFVESLQAQMLQYRNDLEEVNKAVFNMVQPLDPSKITLQDLINCCQAETVVSILIEFHKFWTYENHENNPQNA